MNNFIILIVWESKYIRDSKKEIENCLKVIKENLLELK